MYWRQEVRSTFLRWHLFLGTWRSHGSSFFVWPCKLYCLHSWWMPLGLKHCADRWRSCLQHSCHFIQGVHHRSEPDLRCPLVWKVICHSIWLHPNSHKAQKVFEVFAQFDVICVYVRVFDMFVRACYSLNIPQLLFYSSVSSACTGMQKLAFEGWNRSAATASDSKAIAELFSHLVFFATRCRNHGWSTYPPLTYPPQK